MPLRPVYSPLLVKLLKGAVYSESLADWNGILAHESPIRDYFHLIGLQLVVHEQEGIALLRREVDEGDVDTLAEGNDAPLVVEVPLESLVQRRPLSYPLTLLLVLLRERLAKIDSGELDHSGARRLVMSSDEIQAMLQGFLQENFSGTANLRNLNTNVRQATDLGFLKALRGSEEGRFEVMRLLKIYLRPEVLESILQKLRDHADQLES